MFTKALYYPWIDIHNEDWLKTAALYWAKLHTIVPESIDAPYTSDSAKIMQDAKILEPIRVHSRMRELEDIVPEVLGYLKTDEGLRVLMYDHQGRSLIHPEKLSYALRDRLDIGRLHPDKMNYELRENITRDLPYAKISKDGWLEMPTAFANFYMTLLANKLCATKGFAVVSDYSLYDQFTLRIKNGRTPANHFLSCPSCGMHFSENEDMYIALEGRCPQCGERIMRRSGPWNRLKRRYFDRHAPQTEALADGILAQIVLGSVCIRSDVRIDRIIEFREKHKDSFDGFRGAIQELVTTLYESNNIETLEALRERLKSIHTNKIKPHIEMIERKLNESLISTVAGDFSISGMASMLGLGSGVATFPIIGHYALLAGAGISVVAGSYMYSKRKRELRDDPFSYVLSVKSELGYA